jgi:hypothetical protein
MNKTTRMLILGGIILASSTLASLLIYMSTSKKSWLGFVGWMIFFTSSQAPMLFVTRSSERACSAWWKRLRSRQ